MKVNLELRHESADNSSSRIATGILSEDKIAYMDEGFIINVFHTKEELVLTKENKEYKITINFKEGLTTSAVYETISGNSLALRVNTIRLRREENSIYIHYVVEDINEIKYSIKYEVKE